jgi:hypothetical protein
VRDLQQHPDPRRNLLLSCGYDKTIRAWGAADLPADPDPTAEPAAAAVQGMQLG